jgi:hypothetical protein
VTATWVLGGAAGAVAVTGLLLYLIDHPRVEAPARTEITPAIGADGAGVSFTRRF